MARNGLLSRRRRSSEFAQFSPSVSHDIHVLAVDDSLVDRKVIERLLKITSCKVTAVESGRRALQYLGLDKEKNSADFVDETKVDLIITDYCMPGMSGYELLKKIKGSATFREVPVVIMSSENVLTRIDRCLEEGAEDFIVKPVKLSDVKRIKDHMFGDENKKILSNIENNRLENGINKRKLQDMSTKSSSNSLNSSPPSISSSAPQSPPQMPPVKSLLSIYPTISSSTSSISPPLSSSQLHSPTTQLKVTNFGQA